MNIITRIHLSILKQNLNIREEFEKRRNTFARCFFYEKIDARPRHRGSINIQRRGKLKNSVAAPDVAIPFRFLQQTSEPGALKPTATRSELVTQPMPLSEHISWFPVSVGSERPTHIVKQPVRTCRHARARARGRWYTLTTVKPPSPDEARTIHGVAYELPDQNSSAYATLSPKMAIRCRTKREKDVYRPNAEITDDIYHLV